MTSAFKRRRSDSRAHAIAEDLRAGERVEAGVASVHRLRVPFGSMVGQYRVPGPNPQLASVTASAQVLFGGTVADRPKRAPNGPWQTEAFQLRREIGEFRFAGDRPARALSMVRFFIAVLPDAHDKEPEPVTDGPLLELSRQMFGNQAAMQQQLKRYGQQHVFNGESIIVISQDPEDGSMSWFPYSVREITGTADALKINDGVNQRDISPDELVIRAWTPDPETGGLADSPAQAVLPVARELKGLTEHTSAQIDSRLAGAGLLLVPDNIEILSGQASSADEGEDDGDMDPFVRALVESMATPLKNRDSAASIVPLVAKVPADSVDKIRHITFAAPIDQMAKDMREESIRRIGLGMDSDPAVLLGMGGGNHWSAWLVSEEETQIVVSPMAATLCHALTVGWARPVAAQLGLDASRVLVWFDPSELQLRPDKSADARALRDADLVSDAVALRENGFDPVSDAPSEAELERRVLLKLLYAKPDLYAAILPKLGIVLDVPAGPEGETTEPSLPAEPEEVGVPDVPDEQDRELPERDTTPPPPEPIPEGP